MSMNQVTLIGNLGADVEIREAANGTKIAKLRLATKHRDSTQWHTVKCFNREAENAVKFLGTGDMVSVSGYIEYDSWAAEDGTKKFFTNIIAHRIGYLKTKGKGGSDEGAPEPKKDVPF